jgi:hypothetical protein
MQANTKLPHASDPVTPKVKQEGRQGRKDHCPREDEEVKPSEPPVQPPIQRPDDGPEVALQSEQPIPREPDDPETTSNTIIDPIKRSDDDPVAR